MVVYDELEAVKPIQWTTQMHSPYLMKEGAANIGNAKVFELEADFVKSNATVFSSSNSTISVHDKYNYPAKNWKGKTDDEGNIIQFSEQWHAGISSSNKNKQRFLMILQVQDKALKPLKNLGINKGVQKIQVGEWTISANLDTKEAASLSILSSDQKAAFSYGNNALNVAGKAVKINNASSSVLIENGIKQEVIDTLPAVVSQDIGN